MLLLRLCEWQPQTNRALHLALLSSASAQRVLSGLVPGSQMLELEVASIMKGAFDHFMQKEIHEQPEAIMQTLLGRISMSPAGSPLVRRLPACSLRLCAVHTS